MQKRTFPGKFSSKSDHLQLLRCQISNRVGCSVEIWAAGTIPNQLASSLCQQGFLIPDWVNMHQWQGQRHGHHLPMHRTETIWSATVECQVSPFKATDSCYILTNISPEGLVRVANLFFPVPATYWAVIGFLYIRFYGYTTSDDHICIKSKFMLRKLYTHILERTGRCNRWLITQHEVTGVRSNTIVAVPYSELGLDSKSGSNPAMSRIGGSSPIRGWV